MRSVLHGKRHSGVLHRLGEDLHGIYGSTRKGRVVHSDDLVSDQQVVAGRDDGCAQSRHIPARWRVMKTVVMSGGDGEDGVRWIVAAYA
jgi:hypothetical protein